MEKPGWKTTEFWIAILTVVVGLGLLVYGVITDSEPAITIGASLAGVSVAGYSVSRGMAKKG